MAPSVELNAVVGRDVIMPREMTVEDIVYLVGKHIQAAKNAQAAVPTALRYTRRTDILFSSS